MLFKSAKLQREELRVIEAISKIYKSIRFALSSPTRWNGVLSRNTLARAIRGSNSIEGYLVSKEDAIAAVDGEEPLDAERETWLEIIGYRNAMTYVLQLSKDSQFVFNEGFLRSLHFMVLHHNLAKNPGNWRPGPIYVRDEAKQETVYEAPGAEIIPKLIAELVAYLKSSEDNDHVLVKGAMAHLNLVMIHPFSDGNGRMARCLQTLVLATRGVINPAFCSIEEYLGRNVQSYYDVLATVGKGAWHPENDTRPWIRFIITAHYRQAATTAARMRMIKKLWRELESLATAKALPDRVVYALSDAAMGYHVRSSQYRHNAAVSAVLASRDMKSLVDAGLLVPAGEKRGRIYSASEDIRALYVGIRNEELKQIPDPFEKNAALITD
jgi:Fic family protein